MRKTEGKKVDRRRRTAREHRSVFLLALLCVLSGCVALLPDANEDAEAPWKTYAEAEAVFARIAPGKTTLSELTVLRIDPQVTPNVSILGHADLLRRLEAMINFEGAAIDPAIRQCVVSHACFGYRIEQKSVGRERMGNFWLDFLNFKRVTHVTGWQFDALVLISDNVVIYKSWSGKPNIREIEQERHPLGPLQGLGSSWH